MGDRANVYVTEKHTGGVFLYTHWGGYDLLGTVRKALSRRERWNDAPYLTRIVFSTMTKGYEADATGFGISARITDNQYPVIVLDVDKQEIGLAQFEAGTPLRYKPKPDPELTQTFSDFIKGPGALDRAWTE